ncbi:MAG: phosphatidylglycerophosphatase A [Phycisphaerales bacterium]
MKLQKLVLSCFGIGFLPKIPGTFGSLVMLGAFLAIHFLWPVQMISVVFLIAAIIISSVLCVFYAKRFGAKDPGWVVIDELAGQAVALFPAAVTSGLVLPPAIAAFVLFRVFDIWKPSPIREMEQLRGGFGILADDLVAGVMAGTVVCIITYLVRFALMGH